MKAQCSHCGHTQTLKRASKRRTSEKEKDLFQCSSCHRYSPISPIYDSGVNKSKRIGMNEKDPLVEIASNLIRKGLEKLGFIEPEPEPKKEEPPPQPKKETPSWMDKPLPNRPN
jgi:hypothetical protein